MLKNIVIILLMFLINACASQSHPEYTWYPVEPIHSKNYSNIQTVGMSQKDFNSGFLISTENGQKFFVVPSRANTIDVSESVDMIVKVLEMVNNMK